MPQPKPKTLANKLRRAIAIIKTPGDDGTSTARYSEPAVALIQSVIKALDTNPNTKKPPPRAYAESKRNPHTIRLDSA